MLTFDSELLFGDAVATWLEGNIFDFILTAVFELEYRITSIVNIVIATMNLA